MRGRSYASVGARQVRLESEERASTEVVMGTKRTVEVFSAGCAVCDETVDLVNRLACPSCDVSILDMHDDAVATRARTLGVRSVPAVAIDGTLADCGAGRGPDETALRAAGLDQTLA